MDPFVIVRMTASGCSYCQELDKIWGEIQRRSPGVEFIDVSFGSKSAAVFDARRYPSGLLDELKGFPTILKIKKSSWDRAMRTTREKIALDGKKYSGARTADLLVDWIARG